MFFKFAYALSWESMATEVGDFRLEELTGAGFDVFVVDSQPRRADD